MTAGSTLFKALVEEELKSARECHEKPFSSPHEALGVIREEYLEFEAEVFKRELNRSPKAMLYELTQVAAMCQRAAEDLHLITGGMPSAN